jgi:hypothetical protein
MYRGRSAANAINAFELHDFPLGGFAARPKPFLVRARPDIPEFSDVPVRVIERGILPEEPFKCTIQRSGNRDHHAAKSSA